MGVAEKHLSAGVTVSVVSHGHGVFLSALLEDIATIPEVSRLIVTLNLPGESFEPGPAWRERVVVVRNSAPKGYGANHNAAFTACDTAFFCVLNPDVRLPANPFPLLLAAAARFDAALCVPAVLGPAGGIEDSIRCFPTPFGLMKKALGIADGRYPYRQGDPPFAADWAAGMFMLFRGDCFRQLGGFDEAYFLYYEDVDICARLWRMGLRVVACPGAAVIHAAQRTSRRNLRYMVWHLSSMLRFFASHTLRLTPAQPLS